jgi:FkbM family methyltransferase
MASSFAKIKLLSLLALGRQRPIFIIPPLRSGTLLQSERMRGLFLLLASLPTHTLSISEHTGLLESLELDASQRDTATETKGVLLPPHGAFSSTDVVLIVGEDQLDGVSDPNSSLHQLQLAQRALNSGARVVITGTFSSSPGHQVLQALRTLDGAHFLLHTKASRVNFSRQTGLEAFLFPDFLRFVVPSVSSSQHEPFASIERLRRAHCHLLALNFSELGFRSFFDQHTDIHRQLYVALVLDQILLCLPDAFFFLVPSQQEGPSHTPADEALTAFAAEWLTRKGYAGSFSILPADSTFAATAALFAAADLSIIAAESLLPLASLSATGLLVLRGRRGSVNGLDTMQALWSAYAPAQGRLVAELHDISREIPTLLSTRKDGEPIRTDSAPAALRSGNRVRASFLSLLLLGRTRSLLALASPPASASLHPQELASLRQNPSKAPQLPTPLRDDVFNIEDENVHASLLAAARALFLDGSRFTAAGTGDFATIAFDGDPSFVPDMLERDVPHEDDYLVFGKFRDPNTLVLDIGANWGYSVASIWASGADCGIVSFEAIPMYRPCLQAVAELRPNRYAYFLTALSDETSELTFTVPVVNDTALSALTTAAAEPYLEGIVANVVSYVRRWMEGVQTFRFRFVQFTVPVRRIDDLISSHPDVFGGREIVALKIDVEGMEYPVLRGACEMLRRHRPLLMVETNMSNPEFCQFLEEIGYLRAEREGAQLRLSEHDGPSVNSFFVHKERIDSSRALGLIR